MFLVHFYVHKLTLIASLTEQATNMARAMVTKYGFSEDVGIVFYGEFCCVLLW